MPLVEFLLSLVVHTRVRDEGILYRVELALYRRGRQRDPDVRVFPISLFRISEWS